MTVSWALCLSHRQAGTLAKLYDVRGVEIAELPELVWARGSGSENEIERILTLVPSSRFFEAFDDGRLRPRGRLLSTGRLPDARWMPLHEWLSFRVPTPGLPAELSRGAEVRLVPDPSPAASDGHEVLLMCDAHAFRSFSSHAPGHRLEPLSFVVNDERSEVLIRGKPLPSVPGSRFVLRNGIAIPVGLTWSPLVGASVVRAWLGLSEHVIALWRPDVGISEIAEHAFVSAKRRAGSLV